VRKIRLRSSILQEIIHDEVYRMLIEQDEDDQDDEVDTEKSREDDDEPPDSTETTLGSDDDDEEPGTRMPEDDLNRLLGFIIKYIQDKNVDIRAREDRKKKLEIVTSAVVLARDEADDSDEDAGVIMLDDERDRDKLHMVMSQLEKTNLDIDSLRELGASIVRR